MAHSPLAGKTVLVTRPADRAARLAHLLRSFGARVLLEPLLSFGPPPDPGAVRLALAQLPSFSWLVFVSPAGVDAFAGECEALGIGKEQLQHHRLAAIGPATAEALLRHGLRAEVAPRNDFSSEGLAETLANAAMGQSVLLIRADRGREVLADRLRPAARVVQVAFYRQVESSSLREETRREWEAGRLDFIVATSSAAVRLLAKLASASGLASRPGLVVLSEVTASAARAEGWPVAAVARSASDEGLVAAMVEADSR